MDFSKVLYGPVYRTQAVSATLTLADSDTPVSLQVKDLTAGLQIGGPLDLETSRPAASVRALDLANAAIDIDALDQATLVLNGATWTINAWQVRPSPNGADDGEVYLLLESASDE